MLYNSNKVMQYATDLMKQNDAYFLKQQNISNDYLDYERGIVMKIKFLIPYKELQSKVLDIINKLHFPYEVEIQPIVVAVEDLSKFNIAEADAAIGRGYTAKRLRKEYPQLIIVELPITSYDIFRALKKIRYLYSPIKVGFCGGYSQMKGSKAMEEWLGCPLQIYFDEDPVHIPSLVKQAKKDGCNVILGGYSAVHYARKMGLKGVILESGDIAIENALNETIRSIRIKRNEQVKAEMYRLITKNAAEGILFVDLNGYIRVDNMAAREIAKNKRVPLCHHLLKENFPALTESFYKSIKEQTGQRLDVVKLNTKHTVSATITPVISNGIQYGSVINLLDISRIQDLEGSIRAKLNRRGLQAKYSFSDIIYQSNVMKYTVEMAKKYAKSDANVMIIGDTGTGKEIFAQSIHNYSQRSQGPFVAVNCAALPENLLESELFGYVEGAFTGTRKGGKMGLVEQAHKGTLFLDEISEIPISLQSKLLRVLQEKEVRRIGAENVIQVDVRFIAATNKNLEVEVKEGRFRRDLLYRLDVLRLPLPPLHQRGNDVELLFDYLLRRIGKKEQIDVSLMCLSEEAKEIIHRYPFEGNIRELRNIVERICVLHNDSTITGKELKSILYPQNLDQDVYNQGFDDLGKKMQSLSAVPLWSIKEEAEREKLQELLTAYQGRKGKIAELLKVNRSTLWRKLKKYGLE